MAAGAWTAEIANSAIPAITNLRMNGRDILAIPWFSAVGPGDDGFRGGHGAHRIGGDVAGDAILDDGDGAVALGAADEMDGIGGGVGGRRARIGDRAQRQGQPVAHLLGDGQDLGLLRRQLEGRGLADDDLLAVLVLDGLVDGEHADVVEDGLGQERRTVGLRRDPCGGS